MKMVLRRRSPWFSERARLWTAVAVLAVLALLPLGFAYFPTLDGPVHVAITQILNDRGDPTLPRLQAFFDVSINPEPNWLIYLILLTATKLVPAGIAEKAVVALCVVSLPAALLLFARQQAPDPASRRAALVLVPCAFAFAYNATLYFGFYNYNLSVALFVALTSVFLGYRRRPGPARALLVAGLTLLLFFTHVMGYAVFMLVAGSGVLWAGLLALRGARRPGAPGRLGPALRGAAAGVAPLLPSVALLAYFLWRNQGGKLAYATTEGTLPDRLRWLASLSVLVGNSRLELPLLAVLVGVPLAMGIGALRRRVAATGPEPEDGLILGAVAVLAAALLVPNALFGGGFTAIRIQVFVYLVPILWVIRNARWAPGRRQAPAVLFGAAALLLLVETRQVGAMSAQFAQVVRAAGPYVEADRTVLPVVFAPNGADGDGKPLSRGIAFLSHAYARITAERHAIPLRVHQAQTQNFPVRYAPASDPYRYLPAVHVLLGSDLGETAALADLPRQIAAYEAQAGQTVDYVLVTGTAAPGAPAAAEALAQRLAGQYETAATDPTPPGVVLLRRRAGR